ncbi:pilus assembly protein TadG-related protein [Sphingomonas sp. SM33]|uniref:Pilus assembly protein TadG-related protein n=1 Tax=Sphingomonas telluris TaxID=2907998 RepID=A0ABS9VIH5_9SPHN|nr:pilus assembly protein TadG-related protein [Sphingomonas telluris]MCH8614766.1 pilus assembly protein TadG-related protein [Sphingomonas telluris]
MAGFLGRLLLDDKGSVAPTVALSLVALIAAGGIAFDYARVASMDTELQNAADQAALAAASQLDGQAGACARAAAAAASLLTNRTLFANEATGARPVVVANESACDGTGSIQFYQSYDQVTDVPGTAATTDAGAKVVLVSVNPREAFYALTPIVGALRSGNIGAQAIASLGSAICKMPPVMICNPDETGGNITFNPAAYVGDGLRLTAVGGGSGTWAPGNFGYLDTGGGSSGVPGLREALGWNTPPGDCIETTGVDTKPGANVAVTDSINTRFDIFDSNVSCPTGGTCSPSINSVKDVVRPGNANGGNACKLHNQGWQLSSNYYGSGNLPVANSTPGALTVANTPDAMGYPRDECHAVSNNGVCSGGRMGDGAWDRDAYFRVNYKRAGVTPYWSGGTGAGTWQFNTGLPANATRYQVYSWEMANRGTTVDGVSVLGSRIASGSGGGALTSYGSPQCGTGQVPNSTTPDRRRISVAVVNCVAENVHGNSTNVQVVKWIDVFLVEPSLNRERTNNGDMYVEIIGETQSGGNGQVAGQVIKRDVPYLIR